MMYERIKQTATVRQKYAAQLAAKALSMRRRRTRTPRRRTSGSRPFSRREVG